MDSPNPSKTYAPVHHSSHNAPSHSLTRSQLLEKSLIETDPEVAEIMVRNPPSSLPTLKAHIFPT